MKTQLDKQLSDALKDVNWSRRYLRRALALPLALTASDRLVLEQALDRLNTVQDRLWRRVMA